MIFRHVDFLDLKRPVDGDHRMPVRALQATKDTVVPRESHMGSRLCAGPQPLIYNFSGLMLIAWAEAMLGGTDDRDAV
jgi:hypothetical protein